ncbi:MAG TPA: uroporphyrinogen-III C-methyltransferase [Gallionellaceae bacterium]|nr:uroporphyrinogen-III C-methyltransferase [Gallionellaceae bacterium]
MSEPSNTTPSTSSQPESAKPRAAHAHPIASAIAHMNLTQLTLVVLVVIFLWQWFDMQRQLGQMQQLLAQRLAEIDGGNKANQTLALQSQELVRELGGKLSLLENKFAETQNQRAALESLYQDMSSSRDQMVLAEVEQLLLIAGQQLQLSANVRAALIALQQADSRLQRADRPALAGLRKGIQRDIERLRVLPSVDVSGINARLDNLVGSVETLPLVQDVRSTAAEKAPAAAPVQSGWQRFWNEVWQEARQLVRIENTEKAELPLLSPNQTFFLRENLKLRLLSARLALLARDEGSFKRDVKTAQDWVRTYFDMKSTAGTQFTTNLQKLNAASIAIELPDISASLEDVRRYRTAHERSAR